MISQLTKQLPNNNKIISLIGVVSGPLTTTLTDFFNLREGIKRVGIVLPYAAGGSLDKVLYPNAGSIKRSLSLLQKVQLLKDIADALRGLHSIGCYHGDLKPQNILVFDLNTLHVKVADFGLSGIREIRYGNADESTMSMTASGHTRGTLAYCAVEMLADPSASGSSSVSTANRKTDMYAFGVLAWEILTGRKPFEDVRNNYGALCIKVHNKERPPMEHIPSDVPPVLKELISDCWHHDRRVRPQAIQAFYSLNHLFDTLSSQSYDIFFSHTWADKYLLRYVYAALVEAGYRVWYDENEMGWNLEESMRNGIAQSTVFLCCISSKYQKRPNCMFELKETASRYPNKKIISLLLEPLAKNGDGDFEWQPANATVEPVSSEVVSTLNFDRRMYCDLSQTTRNPLWYPSNASSQGDDISPELNKELLEQLIPLQKILDSVKCPRSLKK